MHLSSSLNNFVEQLVISFSCRVMCNCGYCGSRKQTLSEWEKHTGCRAKKWKHSVKVKSTMLTLEKWVWSVSCYIRRVPSISVGWFLINSHIISPVTWISWLLPISILFPKVPTFWVWIVCVFECLLLCSCFVTVMYLFLIVWLDMNYFRWLNTFHKREYPSS